MGWISGSRGVFRLDESDEYCGSMLRQSDLCRVLGVGPNALQALPTSLIGGDVCINELDVHRAWSGGKILGAPNPRVRGAKLSLDELLLAAVINVTLPGASVIPQVAWGKRSIDLRVQWGSEARFIEFLGPSHFQPQPARTTISPLQRKHEIEAAFGIQCVLWPFWIQRCSSNVKALFDDVTEGRAAVWSTKSFFGDFTVPNAAELIVTLTERFRAVRTDGIGYMYGDDLWRQARSSHNQTDC